jgi:outer membrane protein assembly factor BamD (BamD/ComL family)
VAAPLRARRPSSAAPGKDTSVVLEAMRALRLERNPVRARVLLARYLDRHPTGTLAEEALAMSIEAAVAHHDADAAALGARYLRLYPGGPFHELALQTQR